MTCTEHWYKMYSRNFLISVHWFFSNDSVPRHEVKFYLTLDENRCFINDYKAHLHSYTYFTRISDVCRKVRTLRFKQSRNFSDSRFQVTIFSRCTLTRSSRLFSEPSIVRNPGTCLKHVYINNWIFTSMKEEGSIYRCSLKHVPIPNISWMINRLDLLQPGDYFSRV